jgi:hypothetical protein
MVARTHPPPTRPTALPRETGACRSRFRRAGTPLSPVPRPEWCPARRSPRPSCAVQAERLIEEMLIGVLVAQTEVPTATRVRLMRGLAAPASPDLWSP